MSFKKIWSARNDVNVLSYLFIILNFCEVSTFLWLLMIIIGDLKKKKKNSEY